MTMKIGDYAKASDYDKACDMMARVSLIAERATGDDVRPMAVLCDLVNGVCTAVNARQSLANRLEGYVLADASRRELNAMGWQFAGRAFCAEAVARVEDARRAMLFLMVRGEGV